jgi:hypothetical protein
MDEALRLKGLDESKMAEMLVGVVARIEGKRETQHGDDKLLMDVVKECNRHFESPPATRAAAAPPESRVIINLIHNVRRPVRPPVAAALPVAIPEADPGANNSTEPIAGEPAEPRIS